MDELWGFVNRGRAAQRAVDELGAGATDPASVDESLRRLVELGHLVAEASPDGSTTYRLTAAGRAAVDFMGFTLHAAGRLIVVRHRCGWEGSARDGAYLADVINGPVADHRRDGCSP